jgi:formylglycine-generating enzyme required for sulfatase activity/aminoglycoside phosphotransferase (APT) family kinase protein
MAMDPLLERLARALAERYAIVRELGHGGMGAVYLATDHKLGREVAIKVLPPSTRQQLGAERFEREVQLVAQLSHPHIVPLFEAGEADGLLFYVMECIEGDSLERRLAREGPLPLDDALRIAAEVGDALQYAHERGIVHRDIKPANILLCRGHAMVTDFGIAKAVAAPAGESLTATGVSVGTPAYMSPEQAGGDKRVDARTDVYALAAVLYEMLAGQPPFSGTNAQAVFARVLADTAPPIRTVRPGIPPHVEDAIAAGLAKLSADRPPSARAFVDLLVRPTAERPVRGRRTRPAAIAGAAALVAAGVWAAVALRAGRGSAAPPAGMVLVPAGSYRVGGGPGRAAAIVRLDSFYIDALEVTVADYARFLAATGEVTPWRAAPPPDWPVVGMLWAEADAYCRWRGGRLPTEEEWEAAARGPEGWRHPWGDAWAPGMANAASVRDTIVPVGSFPLGRSFVAALDLIGNAWEWTATTAPGSAGEARHVIKGGAYNTPPVYATALHRAALPDDRAAVGNTGVRCARTLR